MRSGDSTEVTPASRRYSGKVHFAILALWLLFLAGCSDGSGDAPREARFFCPADDAPISSIASRIDVQVDFFRPETVATLTGVLHGVTDETPFHAIADIRLAAARGSTNYKDVLDVHGITPAFVVSDFVNLGGVSPATDWEGYEAQVRALAIEHGTSVIYDIWNEPDQLFFWPFWAGMSAAEDNAQRLEFFEAFKRAHDVIREVVGDDAVISGPSFGGIDEPLLRRFMDFSLREGLSVQVLSVHAIYNPDNTFADVEQQLSRLYLEYIAGAAYAAVGVIELHVNEYGAPKQYGRPGSMLALIRVMERAGVAQAMRAIWGPSAAFSDDINGYLVFAGIAQPLFEINVTQNDGNLSDLLTPDFQTRPIWWAYKFYADGADSRVWADTSLGYIMPLASSASVNLDNSQLLLASYDSENYPERTDTVGIQLDGLPASTATVKLTRIPYDDAAVLAMPTVAYECDLRPGAGGQLALSVEAPGDYEVLAVTVEQ